MSILTNFCCRLYVEGVYFEFKNVSVPSMVVGVGEEASPGVRMVVPGLVCWLLWWWWLFCNPRWRSRSHNWSSSFLMAGLVSLWKCRVGEDSSALLVTSGLDSWSPTILPPHLRLTPAIGTLGTVWSIVTPSASIPSSISLFLSPSRSLVNLATTLRVTSLDSLSDSTLSSFISMYFKRYFNVMCFDIYTRDDI